MNTKSILLAALLLAYTFTIAQQWNGSTTSTSQIYRTGNVSIGASYDLAKFNIILKTG
jgi:hypothetical protein